MAVASDGRGATIVIPRTIATAHTYHKASRLTLGLFPWHEGAEGVIAHAGSGVFVTPKLALTAKHVTHDFLAMDQRVDRTRPVRPPFQPTYSTLAFQADLLGDPSQPVTWSVEWYAPSEHTDMSVVSLLPEDDTAKFCLNHGLPYFEWSLLPPPIGEKVYVFGMPGAQITQNVTKFAITTDFSVDTAHVTANYPILHSHGFLEFPCFEIDKPLDHGYSGGAVIWQGRLCGIVSAERWIASLWPILLMTYDKAGTTDSASELFKDGTLTAADWDDVEGHVTEKACTELEGCMRNHAHFEE